MGLIREAPEGSNWTHLIAFRLSAAQHAAIVGHAKARGMEISEHIRDVMLRAAKGEFKLPGELQKPLF